MYSNFITPPDFVDNVLIVDASAEEIQLVTEFLHNAETTYNVYMYRADMDDTKWLNEAVHRANIVLQSKLSDINIDHNKLIKFGEELEITGPVDYFNK